MANPSVIALILLALISNPAIAFINCGQKPNGQFRAIVEKVALYGEENRMTFKDYAKAKGMSEKEVKKLFSGTGILKCDNSGGTVQVTQSQSVVTTAGHIFFDDDCNPKSLSYCKIYLYGERGFEIFDLDLSTLKTGKCDNWTHTNDWAVLKTSKPIPKKFRAYKVDPKATPLSNQDEITVTAGFAKNFTVGGQYPPNVTDCKSLGKNINGVLDMDCDTGKGASGSAIFRRNEVGQFLSAIVSSEHVLSETNQATQIEGEFLKAIQEAAGER